MLKAGPMSQGVVMICRADAGRCRPVDSESAVEDNSPSGAHLDTIGANIDPMNQRVRPVA